MRVSSKKTKVAITYNKTFRDVSQTATVESQSTALWPVSHSGPQQHNVFNNYNNNYNNNYYYYHYYYY